MSSLPPLDHAAVEKYIMSMPNAIRDYPFGENVAVYKVNDKMFALIAEGKTPVRLSLKCDPQLAKLLRDKYDEVMEGYHLNKKHWITVILSRQLSWGEI